MGDTLPTITIDQLYEIREHTLTGDTRSLANTGFLVEPGLASILDDSDWDWIRDTMDLLTHETREAIYCYSERKDLMIVKIGIDNAGGATLEVTEDHWALWYPTVAEARQIAREILAGARPMPEWSNQWSEGVRAWNGAYGTADYQELFAVSDL